MTRNKKIFSCIEMIDRDSTTVAEKAVAQRKLNNFISEAKDESHPLFLVNRIQKLVEANERLTAENELLRSGAPLPAKASLSQSLRSAAKKFTEEMNLRKLVILFTVPMDGVIKFRDIAEKTDYKKSVCTRHLDNLVDEGMINREIDPSDGRGKLISLTPKGKDFVSRLEDC